MVRYLNYDYLNESNVRDELNKIEENNDAEIILNMRDKKCLFILGMLFAKGVNIKLINEKELTLEKAFNEANIMELEKTKSFDIMAYVWSRICDENFPAKDYSNVNNLLDRRIENIKRLGVKSQAIINNPIANKIFLICPVRDASPKQKKWIEDYVAKRTSEGYIIHAPHLHTRQVDLFGGYAICTENAHALATSSEIDIYYDQKSTGSVFDLGVAYALHKPLVLLNKDEIEFNKNDMIDSIVESWPYTLYKQLKLDGLDDEKGMTLKKRMI